MAAHSSYLMITMSLSVSPESLFTGKRCITSLHFAGEGMEDVIEAYWTHQFASTTRHKHRCMEETTRPATKDLVSKTRRVDDA